MLDARPEGQFNGSEPLGFPAPSRKLSFLTAIEGARNSEATGSHVAGAKSVPLSNVVGETGVKDKLALEEGLNILEPSEVNKTF